MLRYCLHNSCYSASFLYHVTFTTLVPIARVLDSPYGREQQGGHINSLQEIKFESRCNITFHRQAQGHSVR